MSTQNGLEPAVRPRIVIWHNSQQILALQQRLTGTGESRITLLQADKAQHYSLIVRDSALNEGGSLSPTWSPAGYPAVLLSPTKAGYLSIWSKVSVTNANSINGCPWQGETIARVELELVTATFLAPLPSWNRSPAVTSHQDTEEASTAFGTKLAGFQPVQLANRHWFFWTTLAAGGTSAWRTSKPVSLDYPGTITQASITTYPQGLHVALQTAEEPGKVALICITGNPTAVSDAGEALQAIQCSSPSQVELPEGHQILDFCFLPRSSGKSLLVLSYAPLEERVTLTLHQCHMSSQPAEQQQQSGVKQEHDQKAPPSTWSQGASYSAVSTEPEVAPQAATRILSSADGMLTGFLTSKPGKPHAELHLLQASNLGLLSKQQLPAGCAAVAISPSSCCLASVHHAGPVAWSDATPKQPILAPASTAADAQTSSTAVKEEEQHHGRLLSQAVEIKTETAVLGANVGHKRKREDCVADEAQQRVVVRFSSLPKEALTGAMQAEAASTAADQVARSNATGFSTAPDQREDHSPPGRKEVIDALVQRWLWSVLSQWSHWDIVHAAQAQYAEQGIPWLSALLLQMDHAVHAEPHHSRALLANALDLLKLALLQGIPDATAQAVRQDVWLRRHVSALETVMASYCSTQELASKSFAPEKLPLEDQQLLRQWLAKADEIATFMLHSIYRWVQKHEQSAKEGAVPAIHDRDAVPGPRLLVDDQTVKRLAKALMMYSVVMQSSSSQAPSDHTTHKQQQAMSRVKQLLAALQIVSQKARAVVYHEDGASKQSLDGTVASAQLAANAAGSFQGAFQLHYTRASGAVSWQALQPVLAQQALPSFQGQSEAQGRQSLQFMAQKLGLSHLLASGPLLGMPLQQFNSTVQLLSPLPDLHPVQVPQGSLASAMFCNGRTRQSNRKHSWQADQQAAKQAISLPSRAERRDAVSGKIMPWFDSGPQTCQNGCCATSELQHSSSAKPSTTLVSQAVRCKWAAACPLSSSPWDPTGVSFG